MGYACAHRTQFRTHLQVAEQQSLHLPRQPVRPEIMAAAHWAHMQPPAPELPAKWSGAASNGPQEEELLQVVQPR